MKKSITIIGAGLGGLSVACRLAKLNYHVTIIEQNDQVGGKASELMMDGFRFDRGPSFMTMIDVFEELFEFCGERLIDYIDYKPLDQTVSYYWPDKTQFTSYNDTTKTVQLLCSELGEDEVRVQDYLFKIKQIYQISKPFALDKQIELLSIFDPKFILSGLQFMGLGIRGSLSDLHNRVFVNPKTRSIFNRWAAYVYSQPTKLPAIMSSVGYAEVGLGLYLPTKGIYGITEGIKNLAIKLGVTIILNTQVVNVSQNSDKTWEITTREKSGGGGVVTTDTLISNLDIRTTYKYLLQKPLPKSLTRIKKAGGSYLIYYWGVAYHDRLKSLGLHTIFFGEDYENGEEFVEQFDQGIVPKNPMVYLNISSQILAGDSPRINGQKGQNWIIIISTPPENQKIDWQNEIKTKKNYILHHIGSQLGIESEELKELIVCEKIMTPRDIQDWTGSLNGDLAGGRLESIKDIISRPAVKSSEYDNLFFVGGSVNPGPGMPMVLLCAKHCVEAIVRGS